MRAWSTSMTHRPRGIVSSGSIQALPDPRRLDRANPPTKFSWSLFWQHWHDLHALGSHWTDSQLRILCWGFKGVQGEIPSEEASPLQFGSMVFPPDSARRGQPSSNRLNGVSTRTFQIGHCFHQDIVHNSILVTKYFTKMGIKTVPQPPCSLDLAPCDFWLFPKLTGCRNETIKEMKEAVVMVFDTLTQEDFYWVLPEVFGTEQVHCSRRRLLRRGLEFHVCTINKSKLATIVEGDPKAPFSIATTPRCRGGLYSFP